MLQYETDLYLRRPQQSLSLPRTSSVAQNDECVANVTCLKHSGPVVASRGYISFLLANRAPGQRKPRHICAQAETCTVALPIPSTAFDIIGRSSCRLVEGATIPAEPV